MAGQDLRTPAVRGLECADRVADSDVIFSETAVQVLDQELTEIANDFRFVQPVVG